VKTNRSRISNFRVVHVLDSRQPAPQFGDEIGFFDASLFERVAVADGDGVVPDRLTVDGDAERRADFVLAVPADGSMTCGTKRSRVTSS